MARLEQQRAERTHLFADVIREEGPDAQIVTQLLDSIGFPGAGANQGIHDAWGYDYVSDVYREMAERAFHTHDDFGGLALNYPRLIYYGGSAGNVFRADASRYLLPGETLDALEQRVADTYLRLQVLKTGSTVDPFFLELMRVGGLLASNAPLSASAGLQPINEALDQSIWERQRAYRYHPSRPLRRFGYLPLENGNWMATRSLLESDQRDDLQRAFADISLSRQEDVKDHVNLIAEEHSANHQSFTVVADRPGFFVLFEGWHPDWRATVNGDTVEVERAFIGMRAIPVLPGRNAIEFRFVPRGWWLGVAASIVTTVGSAIWAFYLQGALQKPLSPSAPPIRASPFLSGRASAQSRRSE